MLADDANIHAAPIVLLSALPPISAVSPSPDSATLVPKELRLLAPVAVSFGPCWRHVLPERVNTHAAPRPPASAKPPISAVAPSPDRARLAPKSPAPLSSLAI